MYVTIVYVSVKPEHVGDFIHATERNHHASVAETGNCRFDILQAADDPCQFVLYEAYTDADQAAEHKTTPHYLTWRETVADWMAEPRRGVVYHGCFP